MVGCTIGDVVHQSHHYNTAVTITVTVTVTVTASITSQINKYCKIVININK